MRTKYRGLTFIELILSLVIIGILAAIAIPLSEMAVKRAKEIELHRNLREIRSAIDKYKGNYDAGMYGVKIVGASGYPKTLQVLLEKKVLRIIPVDPMISSGEWATRSYSDKYDTLISDELDVFDVYSKSEEKAIDGTNYNAW